MNKNIDRISEITNEVIKTFENLNCSLLEIEQVINNLKFASSVLSEIKKNNPNMHQNIN